MRLPLLATLLLVGCAQGQSRGFVEQTDASELLSCRHPYAVSPAFTATELDMVDEAVARWNGILSTPICTVRADEGARRILPVDPEGERWQQMLALYGRDLVGVHDPNTGDILVPSTTTDRAFLGIVLHELGHSLGLRHVDPPAVMAEYTGSAEDFTEADLAECRRVGACR